MAKRLTYNISLVYNDETKFRPLAIGCNESQLFDVLSRHIALAEVNRFVITPIVSDTPFYFKEYTL